MITDCFNKNRSYVMGVSILFIVLLHTHYQLPPPLYISFAEWDIYMLISL